MEVLMKSGELTEKENEILRKLLLEKNIQEYEILVPIGEGRELPESSYQDEIESISGTVVTATDAYGFWLDWINDHYTLGDEKGNWYKININEFTDAEDIIAAQQQLQQKKQ